MKDRQLVRYGRQILVEDFGDRSQEALLRAKVLIVGLGGLGGAAAWYLAAAGVGELQLADGDVVELSNLHRQLLFAESDIGRRKVEAGRAALIGINSDTRLICLDQRLTGESLRAAINGVDLVVDATDNFSSRFEINDSCYALRKMLVSAAAVDAVGQLAVFDFRRAQGPCYRCLYAESNSHSGGCDQQGIIPPVVGLIGVYQALETIRLLTGFGTASGNRLMVFDGRSGEWRKLTLNIDPKCPICSENQRS